MGTRVDEALAAHGFSQLRIRVARRALAEQERHPSPVITTTPETLQYYEESEAYWRRELRHAVIMEGANVDCRAVRDGGG